MTLAIERVLEPFAGYIVPSTTMKKARASATGAKVARVQAAQQTTELAVAQKHAAVARRNIIDHKPTEPC